MKDLLVDIGNTRVKWSLYRSDSLGAAAALNHRSEGIEALRNAWRSLPRPDSVWVSNVSGEAINETLEALTVELWGITPNIARVRREAHGITVAYRQPERLGVDRWLVMIAACRRTRRPAVIVDCGTAATLDAIDADGRQLGGLIAPGLRLMSSSLFSGTRIPDATLTPYFEVLGTDTQECIAAGALQALAGMTERAWREVRRRTHDTPMLLLTGRDASALAGQLDVPSVLVPNLVLEGLSALVD